MSPIDLTVKLLELNERVSNPIEYWKKHCVNCGVIAGDPHVLNDCPPQFYEKEPTNDPA